MEVIRSWLIAPANRPAFLAKFPTVGADACVMDLEDGTPEPEKASTRAKLREIVGGLRAKGMPRTLWVRTNQPGTPHIDADLDAALDLEIEGVCIPKLATVAELKQVAERVARAEQKAGRAFKIIGGIESALGAINVTEIAQADSHLVALYFGAEDFATDLLGARRTPGGLEVLYARSRIVLAAKAMRMAAIDQGVLEIRDDACFRADSEQARNLGYDGKVCLNPRQVQLANELFSPSPSEVDFASRCLAAYDEAEKKGIGTIDFQGLMIDGPLLKRCRRILEVAATGSKGSAP